MLDPELARSRIGMGQRATVIGQRMGEERRIEIQPEAAGFAPVDPALKMGEGERIAFDFAAAGEVGVTGVEIETVPSGNQRQGLVEIAPQFVEGAGLARIISRRLDSAACQLGAGMLEPAHVVPLPAMQGDRDTPEPLQSGLGVHGLSGVYFLGDGIRG